MERIKLKVSFALFIELYCFNTGICSRTFRSSNILLYFVEEIT
jgi:hypothetical protein